MRDKLRHQVDLLRRESQQPQAAIGAAHLRLLALVSTAAEYECRLDATKTCDEVGLSVILDPVAPFEREYLLRRFNEAGAVGGLHAIRSHLLVEYLFQASPDAWVESAQACLTLLLPADLEQFLLCVFSRRPTQAAPLVTVLARSPSLTWEQAGGITRALLWCGLSRYEENNRELLLPVTSLANEGWMFIFDGFVATDDPESFKRLQQAAASVESMIGLIQEKVRPTPKAGSIRSLHRVDGDGATFAFGTRAMKPIGEKALAEFAYWAGHKAVEPSRWPSAAERLRKRSHPARWSRPSVSKP